MSDQLPQGGATDEPLRQEAVRQEAVDAAASSTTTPIAATGTSSTAEPTRESARAASVAHPSPTPVVSPAPAYVPVPPRFQIAEEIREGSGATSYGWLWLAIVAGLLFAAPILFRMYFTASPVANYTPPSTSAPALAMTPEPTATAWAWAADALAGGNRSVAERAAGPVVIDYAHFNQIDARGMQPLAAALSRRGLSTRVWLTEVDPFAVTSGFPDQSKELAEQLRDASALVVISPFFYWTPEEIAVTERFVADGGRLLLISDPDIYGDAAVYMNLLAEPFGVVFNDDYLYDTVRNDENFTHFFQGEFLNEAEGLAGLEIAFYGGRSISGDVEAQAISAPTTLSSRRTGINGFTTVAIAAGRGWADGGRVLAMSDFDVLTEPNVVRHDNQQMVEFVADFLAAGERGETIADFPDWLDQNVTLMVGSEDGLDADTLLVGAQLQRRLEETGRTLTLAGAPFVETSAANDNGVGESESSASGAVPPGATVSPTPQEAATEVATNTPFVEPTLAEVAPVEGGTIPLPSDTVAGSAVPSGGNDLILLADYDYANDNTGLLPQVGILLEVELVTPTPGTPAAATATSTPMPAATSITPSATITESVVPDSTPLLPTETPPPDATPEIPENRFGEELSQGPPPVETPEPEATDEEATDEEEGASEEPAARPAPGNTGTPGSDEEAETAQEAETDATTTADSTAAANGTETPTETPTPSPTPTPIEVLWLVTEDGLRLLADQTVLVIRTTNPFATPEGDAEGGDDPANAVVVLGSRAAAINAGVKRLLEGDFKDCIVGSEVTYCPIAPEAGSASQPRSNGAGGSASTTNGSATPRATGTPAGTVTPGATPAIQPESGSVLLIDDDTAAVDGEIPEADRYLSALLAHGVQPDLWTTSTDGLPTADDLAEYKWVIWSNAGFAAGEVPLNGLDALFSYINTGGRLTVSSLKPFFAMGVQPPSTIVDVAVVDDQIALSKGLYSPVNLEPGEMVVAPLAEPEGEDAFDVTLVRGEASEDAGAPAMVSATDEGEEQEFGAKLIVVGMSVGWLPIDFGNMLIANMADWMLEE